jgi:hypothetical protein
MLGSITGCHSNLGSGLMRREVESMDPTAGCAAGLAAYGSCWLDDLYIRGTNPITGVGSPRCARTTSAARASVLRQEIRRGSRSA